MGKAGTLAALLALAAAPASGQLPAHSTAPVRLAPITSAPERIAPLVLHTTAPHGNSETLRELCVVFATSDTIYHLTIKKDPAWYLPGSNDPGLVMALDSFGALQPGERYRPIPADTLANMRNLGFPDNKYFNLKPVFALARASTYTGDYSEFCRKED